MLCYRTIKIAFTILAIVYTPLVAYATYIDYPEYRARSGDCMCALMLLWSLGFMNWVVVSLASDCQCAMTDLDARTAEAQWLGTELNEKAAEIETLTGQLREMNACVEMSLARLGAMRERVEELETGVVGRCTTRLGL
jgi:hypothetical protein